MSLLGYSHVHVARHWWKIGYIVGVPKRCSCSLRTTHTKRPFSLTPSELPEVWVVLLFCLFFSFVEYLNFKRI